MEAAWLAARVRSEKEPPLVSRAHDAYSKNAPEWANYYAVCCSRPVYSSGLFSYDDFCGLGSQTAIPVTRVVELDPDTNAGEFQAAGSRAVTPTAQGELLRRASCCVRRPLLLREFVTRTTVRPMRISAARQLY